MLLDLAHSLEATDPRREVFADEYATHLDRKRAAAEAGYNGNGKRQLIDPRIADLVKERLNRKFAKNKLNGDYIRDYLFTVLEFCPTDYCFSPLRGDNWCISPADFHDIPSEVRRLVDSVTPMAVGDCVMYVVRFVSKNAALALACRYVLTQSIDLNVGVNWGEVAGGIKRDQFCPLEAEIQRVLDETERNDQPVDSVA